MKVGLVFGGKSVEHAVSIRSASEVSKALNELKAEVFYFYIDENGFWFEVVLGNSTNLQECLINKKPLVLNLSTFEPFNKIDVFFPLVHGSFGEDGCLQGLFELIDKPYIGPGVLSSAVCMDKEMAKRLVEKKGILVGQYMVYRKGDRIDLREIEEKIGFPCFIKPASLGSSVGISKVYQNDDLHKAIDEAFYYDEKILIEKTIVGQEIECGVIGSKKPQASFPIRLIVSHDFYSYDAKYIDPNGMQLEAPFMADEELIKKIQEQALIVYKELGCFSMARVDFFLDQENELYFNEINTIPGFTSISGFPIAWMASGIEMVDLVDILITESLFRKQNQKFSKKILENVHHDAK